MDPTNPDRMMAAMWERVRRPNSSHLYGPSSGIYKTWMAELTGLDSIIAGYQILLRKMLEG
ncbi:MAG: hypothetical protein U5J96_18025 [Ignavibacteriaceae bacterium]|nr:hypothetical protein [Ignavibacteriaceae bacterium]